jgi:hypothetical protein
MVHGTTQAALNDARAPGAAARPFASTSNSVWIDDGSGRVLALGAQVSESRGWCMRAIDPTTQAVRWEALQGSHFEFCPETHAICARGGRVYIGHEGQLYAIEAQSGRVLWKSRLSARMTSDPDAARLVGDEANLREIGPVILVGTENDRVTAYDRESGAALWQRPVYSKPKTDGSLLLVNESAGKCHWVDPRTGEAKRAFCGDARIVAGGIALAVDDRGPEQDESGVAFVDGKTGAERWFVRVGDVDLDPGCVCVGGELLVPIQADMGHSLFPIDPHRPPEPKGFFARLFSGGPTTRALPWAKHHLEAMFSLGDALVVAVRSLQGVPRFAVLDPKTLAVRHDSGEIGDGVAPGLRIGSKLIAYSFGESNGPKTLRMVDPANGRQLWERTFDDLDEVAFRGTVLALRTSGAPLQLLEPTTGRTLASC